jgi:hypothetical protein
VKTGSLGEGREKLTAVSETPPFFENYRASPNPISPVAFATDSRRSAHSIYPQTRQFVVHIVDHRLEPASVWLT